jgi:hypothetical protein
MLIERALPLPPQWLYLVRFIVVLVLIALVSRPYLAFRPSFPRASAALSAAAFATWVARDVLFSYRHHYPRSVQNAGPSVKKANAYQ